METHTFSSSATRRLHWAGHLADSYETQRYAVAVSLSDRDRPEVNLYNLVQQQVRVPARVRVRGI